MKKKAAAAYLLPACLLTGFQTLVFADPTPNTALQSPPLSASAVSHAVVDEIVKDHKDLESAEKTGQFDTYRSVLLRITSADFNFNTLRHISYTREQYLKGKQAVMADDQGSENVAWKVGAIVPGTVDRSVSVTATRTFSGSIHDTNGLYGAKGAGHTLSSTGEYWEHWVQPKPDGGAWLMDDWDVTSLRETVDGKPFTPSTTPTYKPVPQRPATHPARPSNHPRNYTFSGNQTTTF